MSVRSSNMLLCVLMLLTSIVFFMHSAKAASENSMLTQAQLEFSASIAKNAEKTKQTSIDAGSGEHCLTHAVFMIPAEICQSFVMTSQEEYITNSTVLVFETYYQLLRPPKS